MNELQDALHDPGYQRGKQMSVKVLMFTNTYDHFQFQEVEDGSKRIEITVNGQANYIDRNQAHMLMLWLQEHLK